jgi:hypothetical protein
MAGVPEQRKPWLQRKLGELTLRQAGKTAFMTFLAATALFGGLDTVDTGVTAVQPDEPFDDGAAAVAVTRATLVPKLTAGDRVLMTATAGSQFLAVPTTVTNTSNVPVPLRNELDLRMADARKIGVFRLDDGSQTASLGPGLTDRLAFVWQVPSSGPQPGDTATVRIWRKTYQELNVTYGQAWIDSLTDYRQVELPVRAPS